MSSRVNTTALLAKAIADSKDPPSVWISTSAVSFYPPSQDNDYDETVSVFHERNWASKLSASIEDAAKIPNSQKTHTRSVMMRLGMVLSENGGAYPKWHNSFACCLGGTIGDGSQWFPYVHLTDVVRAYEFAIFDNRPKGPLNVVAPTACTNKEFTKALAGAMKRPTFLSVPSFVSTLIGEERGSILFEGQHVKPKALSSLGFIFDFPDITSCCTYFTGGLLGNKNYLGEGETTTFPMI